MAKIAKGGILREREAWTLFFQDYGRSHSVMDMFGYLVEPNNENFIASKNVRQDKTVPLKSSQFLIGYISYPGIWEVKNTLSLSPNLAKKKSRVLYPF